jgi:hypothetical protein
MWAAPAFETSVFIDLFIRSNIPQHFNTHWRESLKLSFVGAFEKLREATISFVMSVCPSVRMEQLGSHWTVFHEIWYLSIFRKYVEKIFKFNWNLTRIAGTLHEEPCTFLIILRWILLRMINISEKSCRENQDTHFTLNNFSSKIVPCVW